MSGGWLDRAERLFGEQEVASLATRRVAVFGIGGVGGFAVEALARSGVGALDLIDHDTVSESNLNRQIIALHSTLGQKKTDAVAARLRDINPALNLTLHDVFYLPETAAEFDFTAYDYVLDCIDTVKGKVGLVLQARAAGVPIISAMGCAGKTDPSRLRVADIFSTSVCPLAKVMRTEMRKHGVPALKVVFSDQPPVAREQRGQSDGVRVIGSSAFVPSAAGLLMASEVIKDLLQ